MVFWGEGNLTDSQWFVVVKFKSVSEMKCKAITDNTTNSVALSTIFTCGSKRFRHVTAASRYV